MNCLHCRCREVPSQGAIQTMWELHGIELPLETLLLWSLGYCSEWCRHNAQLIHSAVSLVRHD